MLGFASMFSSYSDIKHIESRTFCYSIFRYGHKRKVIDKAKRPTPAIQPDPTFKLNLDQYHLSFDFLKCRTEGCTLQIWHEDKTYTNETSRQE